MSPGTFSTLDAVVGPFSTFSYFDALTKTLDLGTFTSLDAKVCGRTFTSLDALVSDTLGTYRGVVADTTERDALPNLVPGDIVDVQQGTAGLTERHIRTSSETVAITQAVGSNKVIVGNLSSSQAVGQSIQLPRAATVVGLDLWVIEVLGAAADSILVELLTGSMTGTVVATSAAVLASTLVAGAFNRFTFGVPYVGTILTNYYLRVTRTGALDGAANVRLAQSASDVYDDGAQFALVAGTWGSALTTDIQFQVITQTDSWAVTVYNESAIGFGGRLDTLAKDDMGVRFWSSDPPRTPTQQDV